MPWRPRSTPDQCQDRHDRLFRPPFPNNIVTITGPSCGVERFAGGHHFRRRPPDAGDRGLSGQHARQIAEFRQLVQLLQQPHADDEDRRGTGLQQRQRQVPRRLHHHEQQRVARHRGGHPHPSMPTSGCRSLVQQALCRRSPPIHPVREILSRVGQYYAHKFGAVTTYKATITVGGSGATHRRHHRGRRQNHGRSDVLPTTSGSRAPSPTRSTRRRSPTSAPRCPATSSPSSDRLRRTASRRWVGSHAGGGMTFARTAFTSTTTTSQLNGITPADPIQYSCQQNFIILSTDGYWNGSTTYDLNGNTVGNVDAPRRARSTTAGSRDHLSPPIHFTRNSSAATGGPPVQTLPAGGTMTAANLHLIDHGSEAATRPRLGPTAPRPTRFAVEHLRHPTLDPGPHRRRGRSGTVMTTARPVAPPTPGRRRPVLLPDRLARQPAGQLHRRARRQRRTCAKTTCSSAPPTTICSST